MGLVTQEVLIDLIYYNSLTGDFTWNRRDIKYFLHCKYPYAQYLRWNNNFYNKKAGGVCTQGYRVIKVFNKQYRAHRLAWLYTYGYFPENQIDHINRGRLDNRIENLREVSPTCNVRNASKPKNNTSGVVGVSFNTNTGRWICSLKLPKYRLHLGYFDEFKDAVLARYKAEIEYDYLKCSIDSTSFDWLKRHNYDTLL